MNRPIAPISVPSLATPHGFFTRRGGVSRGPYASLNCALRGADDPASVQENRALATRAIGADPAALHGIHQVHGTTVFSITRGLEGAPSGIGDAMVTDVPGVVLGILTADCAPVLLFDAEAGVVGAAHAGWRGALAGVLEATLDAMERLGALRGRIRAAIGPAIGPLSYEVAADLRDAVRRRDEGDARFFTPGHRDGHWQFDLPGYCRARLATAGVTAVTLVAADTAAEPERFFSNRRRNLGGGGPIGHQISLITLPGAGNDGG